MPKQRKDAAANAGEAKQAQKADAIQPTETVMDDMLQSADLDIPYWQPATPPISEAPEEKGHQFTLEELLEAVRVIDRELQAGNFGRHRPDCNVMEQVCGFLPCALAQLDPQKKRSYVRLLGYPSELLHAFRGLRQLLVPVSNCYTDLVDPDDQPLPEKNLVDDWHAVAECLEEGVRKASPSDGAGASPAQGRKAAQAAPQDLVQWAGGTKATLAVVFTDIVSSAALGNKLGNCAMDELRRAHFAHADQLVSRFGGRVVKTNGDSVMAVFRAATDALDFAMAVNAEPGDSRIEVRAGLHVGPVTVEEADVNGVTVNRAARVVHAAAGAEVWLSSEAKSHVDQERSPQHASLQWVLHRGVELKGFSGKHMLWSLAGR